MSSTSRDTRKKRSVALRVVLKIVASLALLVVFVVSLVFGVLLHLDTGGGRRVVAGVATRALDGALPGRIDVERIGHLGLDGITGIRARIFDPDGVQVLFADDLGVDVAVVPAVKTLLSTGRIDLDVARAHLAHADVNVDAAPSGDLRLARAFSDPNAKKDEAPPGKKTEYDVRVAALDVGHLWAHGTPPGAPLVDAEIFQLAAKGRVDPRAVAVDLANVRLVGRSLPRAVDPRGTLSGQLRLPMGDEPGTEELTANVAFDGNVAGLTTRASGSMKGPHVEAGLFVRSEDPNALRELAFDGLSSEAAVTLQADVKGDLPRLDARATAAFGGRGRMETTAQIAIGPVTRVDATTSIRHVDLSKLLTDAPPSDLGLDAFGHVEAGETLKVDARLATVAGVLDGTDIPPIFVQADVDGPRAAAQLRIGGDVAPSDVSLTMRDEDGRRVIATDAHVALRDLARLPMAPKGLHGKADVKVRGQLVPDTGALSAKVATRGSDVGLGANGARDVRLDATVEGTLARPQARLGGRVEGLRAGSFVVSSADVRSDVTLARDAGGTRITVERPHVDMAREGVIAAVHADRVELAGGDVVVDGAVVDGLGEPIHARFTKARGRMQAELAASSIDLAVVGRLVGKPTLMGPGTASITAGVDLGRSAPRAQVSARITDAKLGGVRGTNLALDASMDGTKANVDLRGTLGDAARITLRAQEVTPKGDPTLATSWLGATGVMEIDSEVDLEKVMAYVPEDIVADLEARGLVSLTGRAARASADAVPDVRLHLKTRGLAYGATPGAATLQGVDLETDLMLDEASLRGEAEDAEVAVRVLDAKGVIAAASAKASLPVRAILADPPSARALAMRAPLQAKVSVPKRDLATLPTALGLGTTRGVVELDVDGSGTLGDPHLTVTARGENLQQAGLSSELPIQAEIRGAYGNGRGDVGIAIGQDGKRVATVRVAALADLGKAIAGTADVPWRASGRVELDRFPLDSVAALKSKRVQGKVTGQVDLVDLHADANLRGQLSFEGLKVAKSNYDVAKVAVAAGKGAGVVSARLQSGEQWLDVSATTGIKWGAELAPALEPSRPLDAHVAARNFSLAVLQPFVNGPVHDIEGTLDGRAKMSFDGKNTTLDGALALSKGKMQVAALGDELRDVRAKVTFSPDGTITVSDVFARGSSGEVNADARVVLQGLELMAASGHLKIDKKDKMTVALDGSPLGEVWGEVRLDAKRDAPGGAMVATVDVPSIGLDLAEKMKSTVRSLEDPVDIDVGHYRAGRRFVELPLDRFDLEPVGAAGGSSQRIVLQMHLRHVEVLRGNMMRIALAGDPKIELGGSEPRVTGEIRVESGAVDLQGKQFEVEQGLIVFTGNASNPTVTATAGWTAEDGTRVFADFIGPVQTGKVNLRSEPGLPKNEILSLILFGAADTSIAAPPAKGSSSNTAATALGGVATQGFTEAVDDLTGVRAQARIDTTRANNPRPEVEVQVSRSVSVAVSHVLGTPPIAEPDKNLARVQWRFKKNWSLETTFGDRGRAMVDGIWSKRY